MLPFTTINPRRTTKKDPRLFPANFLLSVSEGSMIDFGIVNIDQNGITSTDLDHRIIRLTIQGVAGKGVYKYKLDRTPDAQDNAVPAKSDDTYDQGAYVPYTHDQEFLRSALPSSDCQVAVMVGEKTKLTLAVDLRLRLGSGNFVFSIPDKSIGQLNGDAIVGFPTTYGPPVVLDRGNHGQCKDQDFLNANPTAASSFEFYLSKSSLESKLAGNAETEARKQVARTIAVSLAELLNGAQPKLSFALGAP
jgi:hypothetical protein